MPGRLLSLLANGPRLIVSLPDNSPELAQAAAHGGADALKVHIHVHHDASGTQFGDLAAERDNLVQILSLGLPTGIVPGASGRTASRQEIDELAAMGMDFFDLYARDMPPWMMTFDGMTRAVAIDARTSLETVGEFERMGFHMVEAAIVPHDQYGAPLSVADLVAYRQVRRATKLPIIVPTQRAIRPGEAPILVRDAGIDAVMIGAIVTGREPASLRAATQEFAAALSGVSR